jgi:hypothetical protein
LRDAEFIAPGIGEHDDGALGIPVVNADLARFRFRDGLKVNVGLVVIRGSQLDPAR